MGFENKIQCAGKGQKQFSNWLVRQSSTSGLSYDTVEMAVEG